MKFIRTLSLFLLCLLSLTMAANVSVYDLRCEQMAVPIGVDNPRPVFGWKIHSDRRDVMQKAYRIRVVIGSGEYKYEIGNK